LANKTIPVFIQRSSVQRFDGKAAYRIKYRADPSLPVVPDKSFPEGAYSDEMDVLDCGMTMWATAEKSVFSSSGELLYHYK
jgi:hypothetical protein